MDDMITTTEGVKKLLYDLNVYNANEPDGIPARVLKETSKEITEAITLLLKASLIQCPRQYQKHQKQPLSKMESITDETNNHFVNDKDLEILIIASIQPLKRGNKKRGREEVYRLVNDSLNKDITREAFELILNSMIDSHSVNLNVIGKWECLSLPKESCQISDDKVNQNNLNFVSLNRHFFLKLTELKRSS